MSLLDTASLVITPNGTKAGTLYSVVPSSGAGDMTVTRATTATRLNSAGLIESVASNVPRLDYTNGTCPSILVEPQRTNYLQYSEKLIDGFAFNYISGTFTVTENTTDTLDPFGNNNAEKFNVTTIANNDSYTAFSGSGNKTMSIFAKKGTSNDLTLQLFNVNSGVGCSASFNLNTGVVSGTGGSIVASSIKSYGNGWYRCSLTGADTNVFGNINSVILNAGTVYLFGLQGEAGSYATSYIPTTSASVTRNADVISKTGISSLIGQTEGTLFVDAYFDEATDLNAWFLKENATFDTFVFLQRETSGIIAVGYYGSGALQARIETGTSQPIGRYKIAFGYKNNDFVLYINGTQIGTDTSGSVTGLMDYIDLHWTQTGKNKQNNVVLWKTRLTNTQLAQLTTI